MDERTGTTVSRRRALAVGAAATGAWVAPSIVASAGAVAAASEVAGSVACTIAADSSLVGFWRAENNYQDSSGAGNHGSPNGAVGFAGGRVGSGAFSFPGVSDVEVRVPAAASLTMSTAVSMAAWIHPTGPGTHSSQGGIIINREGEYEVARFSDGTINFAVTTTNQGWGWESLGFSAALDEWTHVAIAIDATAGQVHGWRNGVFTGTVSIGAGTIGDFNASADDLTIGGRQLHDQNFRGLIDEAQVFNRVLTNADLQPIRDCPTG